jgi:hypothetical protein
LNWGPPDRVQQGIRFLAGGVRSDIVGGLEVNRIDFAQVNELRNLNVARSARRNASEFFVADQHVLLRLILVAFHDF